MFEQGLVALILANPGVNALIGDRLYPVQGPPDNPTYPYVTYEDTTASSDYTFDGSELRMVRIQFNLWSQVYGDGKAIAIALRNLLSAYIGTLTDGTYVLFASRLNDLNNFDVDLRSYRSIAEYEFQISEP